MPNDKRVVIFARIRQDSVKITIKLGEWVSYGNCTKVFN